MQIKKSTLFKKVYGNLIKACISQDDMINKCLETRVPQLLNDNNARETIQLVGKYYEVSNSIALAETLCDLMSDIAVDVDLFDSDTVSSLILSVEENLPK